MMKNSNYIVLFLLFSACQLVFCQNINICSRDATSYNINGADAADTRLKLSNLANFGPYGAICEFTFSYITTNGVSEALLNSYNCDIYWSGYESNYIYQANEIIELRNWANNGGKIIAGCDDSTHNVVCSMLNLTIVTQNLPDGTSTIQDNVLPCFPNVLPGQTIENGGGAVTGFANFGSLTIVTMQDQIGAPSSVYGENMWALADINMIVQDSLCCLTDGNQLTNNNDFFLADGMCNLARGVSSVNTCFTTITLSIDNPLEGDNIVNCREQSHVSITGTHANPTSTIIVTMTDSYGITIVIPSDRTYINADGTWLTKHIDITSLTDGTITITATETDNAGIVGTPVTTTITKDTTGPNQPIKCDC